MSYLPLQVRISWTRPLEIDDIQSIVIYKYHKKLSRCEDYIKFGTKVAESQSIVNGSHVDELDKASDWHYAVFAKNEVSMAPCVVEVHKVYPDADFDGIEDSVDQHLNDQDNDGVKDDCDADHLRNRFKSDNEGDGIIDECDPDDDNDGVLDTEDLFPFQYNRTLVVKIGENEYTNQYPDGAEVGVIASANETDGDAFLGWVGEVEDTSSKNTSVVMDKDKVINALFGNPPANQGYILSIQTLERDFDDDNSLNPILTGQGLSVHIKGERIIFWNGTGYIASDDLIRVNNDSDMDLDQPDGKLPFNTTGSILKIKIPYGSLVEVRGVDTLVSGSYYVESFLGVQTVGATVVHNPQTHMDYANTQSPGQIVSIKDFEAKCSFIMPAVDTALQVIHGKLKKAQAITVSIYNNEIVVPSIPKLGPNTPILPYSVQGFFPSNASTSGLTVTYVSRNEDLLEIDNDTGDATVKALGLVDVYATAEGNEEYYPIIAVSYTHLTLPTNREV